MHSHHIWQMNNVVLIQEFFFSDELYHDFSGPMRQVIMALNLKSHIVIGPVSTCTEHGHIE